MKKLLYTLTILLFIISCTPQKNSEEFIKNTEGRYLFNSNEVIEIYFKDQVLHAKWRGNDDIELLKVNDSAFYMKELNEKMLFVSKPTMHIELAPKTEHKDVKYHFKKLLKGEKTASEYFKEKEYDKALIAYKKIKEQDSLNSNIREHRINGLGYGFMRAKDYESAIEIFKINIALYPKSSNVYDSMGDLYLQKKDTIKAIEYYKKSLAINPENRSSKRAYKKLIAK